MNMLHSATILMAAAVIAVTISRKCGFGSVLGYIIAGVLIGPWGMNLISNSRSIFQFSEIGVVLLLFVIGLKMKPAHLWALRRSIFGSGSTQVVITALTLSVLAQPFLDSWVTSAIVGFGLSLSSTAFALPLIAERKKLTAPHGRSALHILLFQDLAAVPVLAIIPIIAVTKLGSTADIFWGISRTVAALLAFWLFARFLLRPLLRLVAAAQIREIFASAALLLVLGSALLMQSIGVSMALGAFLAGVMVADSEYRYQLESDIEPFKGLLLGLFFMAVGMTANLGLLAVETVAVISIALAVVLSKGALLFLTGRLTKLTSPQALLLAVCLSQGGEFGFILFTLAAKHELMTSALSELLVMAITLSMMMTPVLLFLTEQLLKRWPDKQAAPHYDVMGAEQPRVIVAGFGRFGQIISRIIRTQKIDFTAIEIDPAHVNFVRQLGSKVYYGDASHKQILDASGAHSAEIFVLAIEDIEISVKAAEIVKRNYPHIKIFARARNRRHEIQLRALGADFIIRDTLLSSMHLAEQVLLAMGFSERRARVVKQRFYRHDTETLNKQLAYLSDSNMLMKSQRDALKELDELFTEDELKFFGQEMLAEGEQHDVSRHP